MRKLIPLSLIGIIFGSVIVHAQVSQQQVDLLNNSIAQNTAQIATDNQAIAGDQADITAKQNDIALMQAYIQQSQAFLQAIASPTQGTNWTDNSIINGSN